MAKKTKNLMSENRRKLIAKLNPKSHISEQYRTIRTNIQFSSVDKDIHTLMVTSSAPGEGKSTTVANMAIVFAQQGKTVLLIDADMRKPTVHYTFQLPNTMGLTNVLTKQNELMEAVHETDVKNLFVLSSGPVPPNPAELLGSKMMDQFMAEASEQFDMILFDTPPVLAVTDAQILANRCDGSLLVVSSGKTEKEQAARAKEHLDSANANIIGVVLNNKKGQEGTYYYNYGNN